VEGLIKKAFNPYFSPNGSPTCLSSEESHFPYTPTFLNIICFLPENVQQRLISSYVLSKLVHYTD
jgi:hypothetical protein